MTHAAAIEERLWTKQEQAIQEYHEMKLAWTLMPASETDIALITKHFPEVLFQGAKGETARLNYESLHLSEWKQPILFSAIESLEAKDSSLGKKILTVKYRSAGSGGAEKVKFQPASFKSGEGDLLAMLGAYYGRYQTAVAHAAGSASASSK